MFIKNVFIVIKLIFLYSCVENFRFQAAYGTFLSSFRGGASAFKTTSEVDDL